MNWPARTVFVVLIAAVIAVGLAAIYMLWELDEGGSDTPPHDFGKFTASSGDVLAPDVAFQDGEQHRVTLADFRGQLVVVNFWATWCAPCVRELPSLDRLQGRLKHKGVKIIALSLDRDVKAVKEFFAENGIKNLDVYFDPTMDAQAAFKIPGLPTTVLIDRAGHDRGRLIGPAEWSNDEAADLVLSAGK